MTPALDIPSPGSVAELAVAADLLALVSDPAERRLFGEPGGGLQEDLVAGEAENVADAVALAPAHRLGPANGCRRVCANCHRLIHARRPWLTLAELRELLEAGRRSAAE
jgi:hypothetical protein